jgi:hypothetical protein
MAKTAQTLPWRQLKLRYWPARAILCTLGLHDWWEPAPGEIHICLRCWKDKPRYTADGVRVREGMEVYRYVPSCMRSTYYIVDAVYAESVLTWWGEFPLRDCYSTREACDKAGLKRDIQKQMVKA